MYGLNMGIQGAAIATVIAQLLSFLFVLRYFLSGRSSIELRLAFMAPQLILVRKILALGFAQFATQFLNSIIALVYNRVLSRYGGAIAVSSYGIINSIISVIILPVLGINQGVQPIIGYNYGAKKFARVKKAWLSAVLVATLFTTTGFIISRFFTEPMVRLFTSDVSLINSAVYGVRIFFMCFMLVGFQAVSSNYFQAKGYPVKAFMMSTLRQGFILIPAIYILSSKFQLEGIWYAAPLADFLSSIITVILLTYDFKKMNEEEERYKLKLKEEQNNI